MRYSVPVFENAALAHLLSERDRNKNAALTYLVKVRGPMLHPQWQDKAQSECGM